MESQTAPALLALRTAAVRLSLFIRKHCAVHSRGACLFLTAYEALNLTSIALANSDYAWYADVPDSIWQGLRLLGQTTTFANEHGAPDYILMGGLLATLSLLLSSLCYFAWALSRLQDFEFRRVLSGEKKVWGQELARITILLCVILHEVLYIPCLDWLNRTSLPVPMAYLLQLWLAFTVIGSTVYFSSYKLGSSTYNSMASPFLALSGKVCYTLLVLGLATFSFSEHFVLHIAAYVLMGGFWLSQVFLKIPYQQDLLNTVEIGKSLLLAWTGIVLLLSRLNTLGGVSYLSMHLILYVGCLLVVLTAQQKYIAYIARKSEVTYAFEVELRLRWHLAGKLYDPLTRKAVKASKELRQFIDTHAIDSLCRHAYKKFSDYPYTLMCFIEYFSILKEKIFVKAMLAKLQRLPKDILSFIDVACCEYAVLNSFAAMQSDQEAVQYLRLVQHLQMVKTQDEILCLSLHRIVDLYEGSYLRSCELTTILQRVTEHIKRAKWIYESLAEIIGDNPVFGNLYAGFLRLFHNPEKAKIIEARLKHMKHEMLAKYRSREESVFFFDQQNLVIVVSLHPSTLGKIILAKGANLLGFADSELTDWNCKVLIPEAFRAQHSDHMKLIYSYRYKHIAYTRVHRQLVLDKEGCCHWAYWKNRLVNFQQGNLDACIAVRLVEEKEHFAILREGKLMDMTVRFREAMAANESLKGTLEHQLKQLPELRAGTILGTYTVMGKLTQFKLKSVRLLQSRDVLLVMLKEQTDRLPTRSFSEKSVGFEATSPSNASNLLKDAKFALEEKSSSSMSLKTQPGLIRLFASFKRDVRVLMLTAGLTIAVGLLAHGGLILSINAQVTDLAEDLGLLEDLSDLRIALQSITLDVRELEVTNNTFPLTRSSTAILSSLQSTGGSLVNLSLNLLAEADAGTADLNEENLDWWKLETKGGTLWKRNSIELAEYLALIVNRIVLESEVDQEVSMEVMRNGQAEALRSINLLLQDRIHFHEKTFKPEQDLIIIPLFAVYYALTVLLLLLSVIMLGHIERQRKLLLAKYAALSTEVLINFHSAVGNRLEQVHSYEFVPCKLRNSRKLLYSRMPIQRLIWGLMLLSFGISIGSYQANFALSFDNLQATLYKQPYVFNEITGLKSSLASILFWMRETNLAAANLTLAAYKPGNNMALSASTLVTELIGATLTSYQNLRGTGSAYSSNSDITAEQFAFLYSDWNTSVPITHCGFTGGLYATLQAALACINTLSSSYSETCSRTDRDLFSLISLCSTDQAYYHTSMQQLIAQSVSLSHLILSLFAAASVGYLGCVYFPGSLSLRNSLKREVDVYLLLVNLSPAETVTIGKQVTTSKVAFPTSELEGK